MDRTKPPATTSRSNRVKAGADKMIIKNGESCVALIDSARLDSDHRLERERINLRLLDDVENGLDDVDAGRTRNARIALAQLKRAAKRSTIDRQAR